MRILFGVLICVAALAVSGVFGLTHPRHRFLKDYVPKAEDVEIQPRSVNRLYNTTIPLRYELELTSNIHTGNFFFEGRVRIHFRVVQATNVVRVNHYNLQNFGFEIRDSSNSAVPLTMLATNDRFLDVFTTNTMAEGHEFILILDFGGTHRSISEGFHYSFYSDASGNRHYLASTQFQSVFARDAFPCYDEPAYRVPLKLTIYHNPAYHALGNAEIEGLIPGGTVFKETWNIPSYLYAFIVSDFECTPLWEKQRICAQPNRMHEVDLAVEASNLVLKWMEATFDEVYDKEKLDHVAIPTFQFGGMENWGLVVYHPAFLLYNPGTSSLNDKINVVSVIAHEIAHMFFGNLITPKWWTYLWLSEGMATLYESYATHATYPELRQNEFFVVDTLHRVLRTDSTGSTRPMTYYVDTVAGIEGIFDSIAYSKAGSVFRMIKYAITESTFHKAMQKYLEENKNTSVDEKPLYKALEDAVREDQTAPPGIMETVMDSWSLQGGYPLLTVQRNYATNMITITQREWISSTAPPTSTKSWSIPVSFTQKTNPTFGRTQANFWFSANEQNVANNVAASDWVIFNLHQSGYYRVNYDNRNWQLLIDELIDGNHEAFPPTNRAQMIDDVNILANYNQVSNSIRLTLMEYLERETDMVPLAAARVHLTSLNRMLRHSDKYDLFRKYLTKLMTKHFHRVEKNFYNDEKDVNEFRSRSSIIDIACSAGLAECLEFARTLVFAELKSHSELINSEDREMIYCHGLKTANSRLFQMFLREYDDRYNAAREAIATPDIEEDEEQYIKLLTRVIGCYGDEEGVEELLKSLFATVFQYPNYRYKILSSVIANGHVNLVLDYLVENLEKWDEINIEQFDSTIITDLGRELFTQAQRDKFQAVSAKLTEAGVTIPSEINEITDNLNWVKDNSDVMEAWLVEHYDENLPGSAMIPSFSLGAFILTIFVQLFIFN